MPFACIDIWLVSRVKWLAHVELKKHVKIDEEFSFEKYFTFQNKFALVMEWNPAEYFRALVRGEGGKGTVAPLLFLEFN